MRIAGSLRSLLLLGCVFLAAAGPSAAQDEPIDAKLQKAGYNPAAARQFFAALRRGLASSAKADVCKLVAYPLAQKAGVVNSAADCELRYDSIFTLPVRRAVGKALFDELFVSPTDLIVSDGEVWMTPCKDACGTPGNIRITQVNHAEDGSLRPPAGKLLLSCVLGGPTEGQWLRMTADGQGGAEMGLWPNEAFPNPNKMPPTVTLKGAAATPKTPECAFRVWSFAGGTVNYTVINTLSCIELPEGSYPPMGSIGQLTRVTAGKGTETVWCIE